MGGSQWPPGKHKADIQQKEDSWELWIDFVDDRWWNKRIIESQEESRNSVDVWRMTEQKGMLMSKRYKQQEVISEHYF